jgi:TatD DNase family protein
MHLTDTHTHLFAEEFDADRIAMLQRAFDKGVTSCFLPNIEVSTVEAMLKVCDDFPDNCFPMMGLHPCSVDANYMEQLTIIKEWFGKRKFYGVGEIGIDLFHDITFAEQQKKAFAIQVEWAKEMNLPIIIHCRNSFNEVMEIVTELHDERLKGIFHCFTGTTEDAKRVMDLKSFKMGIGGVVTYKNSTLPQVLKEVPLPYLVLETDSPYLTPAPFRGKRNESSYIWYVADKISEIYRLPMEKIAEITTQNAREIFGECPL